MIGSIVSDLVAYGIGSEVIRAGASKLGTLGIKATASIVSKSYTGLDILKTVKKTGYIQHAIQRGFTRTKNNVTKIIDNRTSSNTHRVLNSEMQEANLRSTKKYIYAKNNVIRTARYSALREANIYKNFSHRVTRHQQKIEKGFDHGLNYMARNFGLKKDTSINMFKSLIKNEVRYLPATYSFFQIDKARGNLTQDKTFGEYYATIGLPMSLTLGVATNNVGKYFAKDLKLLKNSRGMKDIMHTSASTVMNLNRVTSGFYSLAMSSMSKHKELNNTTGIWRHPISYLKELTKAVNNTSMSKFYKSDSSKVIKHIRSTVSDLDITYKNRTQFENEALKSHRLLSEDRAMSRAHQNPLNKLFGKTPFVTPQLKNKNGIRFQKDYGSIDLEGISYNLGGLSSQRLQDSTHVLLTEHLTIFNQNPVKWIDAGLHLIKSQRSKQIDMATISQTGPGFVNKQTTIKFLLGNVDNPSMAKILSHFGPNTKDMKNISLSQLEHASKEVLATQVNLPPSITINDYLDDIIANERLYIEKTHKDSPNLYNEYYTNTNTFDNTKLKYEMYSKMAYEGISSNAHHIPAGSVVSGYGDALQVSYVRTTGKQELVTYGLKSNGKNNVPFDFLLKASTRAGSLAGQYMSSPGHGADDVQMLVDNQLINIGNIGLSTDRTIKAQEYYNDLSSHTNYGRKILDKLSIRGGGVFALAKNFFNRFDDVNSPYFLDQAYNKGSGYIKSLFSRTYVSHYGTGRDWRALHSAAQKEAKDNVNDVVRTFITNNQIGRKSYRDVNTDLLTILDKEGIDRNQFKNITKFFEVNPESKLGKIGADTFIIHNDDTNALALEKTKYLLEKLTNEHGSIGVDIPIIKKVQDELDTSGSLSYSTFHNLNKVSGNSIDRYNNELLSVTLSGFGTEIHNNSKASESLGSYLAQTMFDAKSINKHISLNDASQGLLSSLIIKDHKSMFENSGKFIEIDDSTKNLYTDAIIDIAKFRKNKRRFGERLYDSFFNVSADSERTVNVLNNENVFIVVPKEMANDVSFGNVSRTVTLPGTQIDFQQRVVNMNKESIITMGAVGTMNDALGLFGLGFDIAKIASPMDLAKNIAMKRLLPIGLAIGANDIVHDMLPEELTGLTVSSIVGDIYAGTRVTAQTISDVTGITDMARSSEALLPGSIDSPLSGLMRGMLPIGMGLSIGSYSKLGPKRGGFIGAGVGLLLGGGPIGLFTGWHIDKGREKVIAELSGKEDIEVSKGRWWELSSGSFWGNKTTYYRPHMRALYKSGFKSAENYLDNDILTDVQKYVDPSIYARKHYYSRPYPVMATPFEAMPLLNIFSRSIYANTIYSDSGLGMHEDLMHSISTNSFLQEANGVSVGSDGFAGLSNTSYYINGEFTGSKNPSFETVPGVMQPTGLSRNGMDKAVDHVLDIAGLRGFLLGAARKEFLGTKTGFETAYDLESAGSINSISRQYWDSELGGLATLSEGIRRIIPNPSTGDTEKINPIPNTMGFWLPGDGSFKDFLVGDPYTKVQMGEARLPGEAYELSHDIFYTYPIDATVLGKSKEEQVSFYAGDISYLAGLRRQWHVVERTRKKVISRLRNYMNIKSGEKVGYDLENNVYATVDGIAEIDGEDVAIKIVPNIQSSDGRINHNKNSISNLNAYLSINDKEITKGILLSLDENGEVQKQIINQDLKMYVDDIRLAKDSVKTGARYSMELSKDGIPVTHWPGYSHLNRLKILVDVAPFAPETQRALKIVQTQASGGKLDYDQQKEYAKIMSQFVSKLDTMKTSEYKFLPLLTGKTPIGSKAIERQEIAKQYSLPEQVLGASWEALTHLRNPISNKLIASRSAMEAYIQDVAVGKSFKSWDNPIDDFVGTSADMLIAEENPIQATISGAIGGMVFGGPATMLFAGIGAGIASTAGLTTLERSSRYNRIDEIYAETEAVKAAELLALEEQQINPERRITSRKNSNLYNIYNSRQQIDGVNSVLGSLSKVERSYVRRIMQNAYAEDMDKLNRLLPKHTANLMDSYVNGTAIDQSLSSNYVSRLTNVATNRELSFKSDDILYKTLSNEGYNAHDVGIGWKQQTNRINFIKGYGYEIPTINDLNMEVNGSGTYLDYYINGGIR